MPLKMPVLLKNFLGREDNFLLMNLPFLNLAVNKQLNDKERVAAALENPNLLDMVDDCLSKTYL